MDFENLLLLLIVELFFQSYFYSGTKNDLHTKIILIEKF